MSGLNDTDFYRRRAAQERALARSAALPNVQAIHRGMADRYAELAQDGGAARDRPELRLNA
jgi:hypothetical protein